MSMTPISSQQLKNEEVYQILKKIHHLTPLQLSILLAWYNVIDTKDKEFGFKGIIGLKEQAKAAVDFLLAIQKEWQNLTLLDRLDISFEEFFMITARKECIDLPDDFVTQMLKQMEEL